MAIHLVSAHSVMDKIGLIAAIFARLRIRVQGTLVLPLWKDWQGP
jgi:hypothetical protein